MIKKTLKALNTKESLSLCSNHQGSIFTRKNSQNFTSKLCSSLNLNRNQKWLIRSDLRSFKLSTNSFSSKTNLEKDSDKPFLTASLITVGKEMLEGKVADRNSLILANSFQNNSIQLSRIEIIPDCKEEIKKTILEHTKKYDLVFTSGCLSSKHNTKIYEMIAELFSYDLAYHQPTISRMDRINRFLSRSTSPEMFEFRKKLARFPVGSRVVYPSEHLWIPLVIVNLQIHIMPGAPELFRDLALGYFRIPVAEFLGIKPKNHVQSFDSDNRNHDIEKSAAL